MSWSRAHILFLVILQSTVDFDSARTIHVILTAAANLICAIALKHNRIMVAEQCVLLVSPLFVELWWLHVGTRGH